MCRIYGYIGHGAVSPLNLQNVSTLQIHGGPDAQTRQSGSNWCLGNNRLAIIDLRGGHQPYELEDHIKVVFNGEVYNHRELRAHLSSRGYKFPDDSDGTILPALYAEYGPDFVRHLNGMFSIAVVDLRAPVTMILATDSVGIKPLYYHWDERKQCLFFSSEIPALLGFGCISTDLWLPGIDAYLTTKAIFGERTIFEAISVMPPSSLLITRIGEYPRLFRWESLLAVEAPSRDLGRAGDALAHLLSQEVRCLLVADVPVSTINSGGLDSSYVTALASEAMESIHSFNISYIGNWPEDERSFARVVAERYRTYHHEVEFDPRDFSRILPDVVWHLGQPNADPITLSSYALFHNVHTAGFKVALSGDGADEMFGGYTRLTTALKATDDWVTTYVDALGAIKREIRWELYSDDYRAYLLEVGFAADAIESQLRQAQGHRLKILLDFERMYRLPAYHLRRVDHLSMAHSVEVRVPYCQPQVADFARQLDMDLKISAGQVKRALYAAAKGLPESILARRKQPFTLPISAMMRPGEPLYRFVREVLDGSKTRCKGIFNTRIIEAMLRSQAEAPNSGIALALWSLMIFELWIQQFEANLPAKHLLS